MLSPIIEVSGEYSYHEGGEEKESGDCDIILSEEKIRVTPSTKEPFTFSIRDVKEYNELDYEIEFTLSQDMRLLLSKIGREYEDFLRKFIKVRNELLIHDLLMHESLKKSGVHANYEIGDKRGECEARLYETGMVILPMKEDPIRTPYSLIKTVKEEEHTLLIKEESREELKLSKMGREFTPFKKKLLEIRQELSLKIQSMLKKVHPGINAMKLRKITRFMKEGKATKRKSIESISPELWKELEKEVKNSKAGESYSYLESKAQRNKICIGLKQGLLGSLTGKYTWFLIPIYDTDSTKPGNVISMESFSEKGGGKATYFFRIFNKEEYKRIKDLSEMHERVDEFINKINKCMLVINFRREPIYLNDEKLNTSRYEHYKLAVNIIPELRTLREHFIGRVIHRSQEQWEEDVMKLLKE